MIHGKLGELFRGIFNLNKIVVDMETNRVMHIVNLDVDDRFNPDWYPNCYIVDDVDNKIDNYGLKYNKELDVFEEIEGYVEEICEILPSDTKIFESLLKSKDDEILRLKSAVAEIYEEKDSEMLKLKLALAELVEGGI